MARRSAVLLSILAVALVALSLLPVLSGAAPKKKKVNHCGNLTVTVVFAPEEGEELPPQQASVKSITAEGLACAGAKKFIGALAKDTSPSPPNGYTCVEGSAGPSGYTHQTCSKPGKKITYTEKLLAE